MHYNRGHLGKDYRNFIIYSPNKRCRHYESRQKSSPASQCPHDQDVTNISASPS